MPAWKKLLQSGAVVNADLSGSAGITSANIANDTIVNADINSSADIHYDKIDFDNSIAYADIGQGEVNSGTIANGAIDLVHMSSESVDEDNLKVSNGPTNGYFLSAQSGNAGGMTWAAIAGDIEAVTAGVGLSGGGSSGAVTLTVDISELSVKTSITDLDTIAITDSASAGASKRVTFENFEDAIFASVSGDIAIAEDGAATIQANSVALSTDTTGNYVGTLTGGTGITSTGATSGEGITHSISVDAAQTQITSVGALNAGSITSGFGTIDTGSSNITTTGTVTAGNLTVSGTTTTISSTNLVIEDKVIMMGTNSAGNDWGGGSSDDGFVNTGIVFGGLDTHSNQSLVNGIKLICDADGFKYDTSNLHAILKVTELDSVTFADANDAGEGLFAAIKCSATVMDTTAGTLIYDSGSGVPDDGTIVFAGDDLYVFVA